MSVRSVCDVGRCGRMGGECNPCLQQLASNLLATLKHEDGEVDHFGSASRSSWTLSTTRLPAVSITMC